MDLEFKRHSKISLRDAGRDESWLQEEIAKAPGMLGLGELTLYRKEYRQQAGGRVDIILQDLETDSRYEVETMLGATDPSHIIRTIEYWDIERRHHPRFKHRAVLIAEEITSRFFNVIWILKRSIPIIAIQLDALKLDGNLLLHFTRVLDIDELGDEAPEDQVLVDRKYWESRSSPGAMEILDRFLRVLSERSIIVKQNYRQDGIALAGKYNFAAIVPRKSGYCLFRMYSRLSEDDLIGHRERLEKAGVVVQKLSEGRFSARLDTQALDGATEELIELVKKCIAADGDGDA